jgi:MFS family permease
MQSVEPVTTTGGPWAPMRVRAFRALWIAALVSNVGTYMQIVGASWAMTEQTDSELLVALLQTAWAAPGFLLALHAGAWSDLLDRRRYLAAAKLGALVVTATLAVLQWAGRATPAVLIGATFLESVALMLAGPAFLAVTIGLVSPDQQPQALGLDAASRSIAQSLGPALAGVLIALAGPGAVFAVNALSFIGVVFVVLRVLPARSQERSAREPAATGVHRAIRHGVSTVMASRHLRRVALRIMLFMAATAVLAAVLPLVARERLGTGAGGFGLLWVALGLGSVGVLQVMPRVRSRLVLDQVLVLGGGLWSVSVLLLAATTELWVALIALAFSGAGSMAVLNTLFPTFTMVMPAEILGRGASLAILAVWLGSTVGASLWGVVASARGIGEALVIAAVVTPLVMLMGRSFLSVDDPLRAAVTSD